MTLSFQFPLYHRQYAYFIWALRANKYFMCTVVFGLTRSEEHILQLWLLAISLSHFTSLSNTAEDGYITAMAY